MTDLKPIKSLDRLAKGIPGCEPPHEELVRVLRAGRQPYPLVMGGGLVLYGWGQVTAARAAGVAWLDVREHVVGDRWNDDERLLVAAGLHLAAVRGGVKDPFEFRRMCARAYRTWKEQIDRRPPRRWPPALRRERERNRQRLIREAFGRAQRSLQRDLVLLYLPPALQGAVRAGWLLERYVEAAEKLPTDRQKELAAVFARGTPFSEVVGEFFDTPGGRRKTRPAAARAIRASMHRIVAEADGRADCFALRPEERPVAQLAADLLSRWLADESQPVSDLDDEVRALAREFGRETRAGGRGPGAARGGRGAAEGRA